MKQGDLIEIDYVGKISSNGETFDLTTNEKNDLEQGEENADLEPINVLVGYDYVVEGLENNLKEMEVGEEREIEVKPEKGFGTRDNSKIKTVSERNFKENEVNTARGRYVKVNDSTGKIISSGSGRVTIDFNHPLAGKKLDYWVRINEKITDPEEKAKGIVDSNLKESEVSLKDGNVKIKNQEEDEISEELKEEITKQIKETIEDVSKVEFV